MYVIFYLEDHIIIHMSQCGEMITWHIVCFILHFDDIGHCCEICAVQNKATEQLQLLLCSNLTV